MATTITGNKPTAHPAPSCVRAHSGEIEIASRAPAPPPLPPKATSSSRAKREAPLEDAELLAALPPRLFPSLLTTVALSAFIVGALAIGFLARSTTPAPPARAEAAVPVPIPSSRLVPQPEVAVTPPAAPVVAPTPARDVARPKTGTSTTQVRASLKTGKPLESKKAKAAESKKRS